MLDAIHDRVLRAYLEAKDENRSHLMADAFAADARFQPRFAFEDVFTDETPAEGLAAVTELFRQLNIACENIYTLCTRDSARSEGSVMTCKWIVTMTQRETGDVRVGGGTTAGMWTWRPG